MFNDKSFRKAEASEPVWGSGTLRSHAVPLKVATSLTMITPFQLQSFSMSDATVQFRILHWTRWRSGMSFILSWKSRASILCLKILSSTTIHNTLVILEATVGVYRDMESWTSLHILVQVLLIPLTHTRVRACVLDWLSQFKYCSTGAKRLRQRIISFQLNASAECVIILICSAFANPTQHRAYFCMNIQHNTGLELCPASLRLKNIKHAFGTKISAPSNVLKCHKQGCFSQKDNISVGFFFFKNTKKKKKDTWIWKKYKIKLLEHMAS